MFRGGLETYTPERVNENSALYMRHIMIPSSLSQFLTLQTWARVPDVHHVSSAKSKDHRTSRTLLREVLSVGLRP
jgi:hypothetical protein